MFFKNKLNAKIWNNDAKIKENVRKKLLQIANKFYKDFDVELDIVDIILTGSNANYNWTKSSDIDIHIVVKYNNTLSDKYKKKLADLYKSNWNNKHDVFLGDYKMELYIQDVSEKHDSNGIYSLLYDKWLKVPQKFKEPTKIDIKEIKSKLKTYKSKIDYLERRLNENSKNAYFVYKKTKMMIDLIKKLRKESLDKFGESGIMNIVYKQLRSGNYIDKLYNLMNQSYDLYYSFNKKSNN